MFSEAHKVLKEHFEESTVTEEVVRSWVTYYGQVFHQVRNTRELIKSLQSQWGDIETLNKTIQDQLVLETTKLDKLEKQAHQWISQANPSLDNLNTIFPYMKRLLDTVEEKAQFLGLNMSNIVD